MTGDLVNFPHRGSRIDPRTESLRAVDAIAAQARQAASSTLALQRATRAEDINVRRAAHTALEALRECAATPAAPDPRLNHSRLLSTGNRIEMPLERLRTRLGIGRRSLNPACNRYWTVLGLLVTVLACWAITMHMFAIAAGLLILRVAVSTGLGYDASLPFETPATVRPSDPLQQAATTSRTSTPTGMSGTRLVVRCLVGHLCDALPLLALAYVLSVEGRPLWASLVLLGVCMMLFATLYRVSSVEVGAALNRLTVERPARVLPLLVALAAGASVQQSVPGIGTPPVVAIAATGPAIYALIEIVRSTIRLRANDQAMGAKDWSVSVSVTECNGQPLWRDETVIHAS